LSLNNVTTFAKNLESLGVYIISLFIAFFIVIRKKKSLNFFVIDIGDYLIILVILATTIFVAINIVNDHSLFISNGTYYYSKFNLIVKSINLDGKFPIYDPSISAGESPFLFETPLMFSHLGFTNIILSFIPPVLFYNTYSFFILFISTLALSLLIRSIVPNPPKEFSGRMLNTAIITLGSLMIGLHFFFVQSLESFKSFVTFPIDYLLFSLILEKPKNVGEIIIIGYLIVLVFTMHVANGIGIVLLFISLIFLIFMKLFFEKKLSGVKNWIQINKTIIFYVGILLILLPIFYIMPVLVFADNLEDKSKMNWKKAPSATYSYIKDFVSSQSQLSLKYPDVNRNDDKKFGAFISIFGLLSFILIIALYKLKRLNNARLFAGAYILHFFISSIIINNPIVGSMEYGYRTATPYSLIVLVALLCAIMVSIEKKYLKVFFILIFLIAFVHMAPIVKKNIENIHREEIIAGNSFKQEINFVKNLPNDGRIITYGLFSSAVDPAMASLTDKYFSRDLLTTNPRSRGVYNKIHSTNAWGQEDYVLNKSGTELSNYLKIGGYKYIFANVCHPVGNFIVKNLYPQFTYPIYQNQCLMFFIVNNTNYVEKISILKDVDEEEYKIKEGFKYYALSKHFNFGDEIPYSQSAITPEALNFERISPVEVRIHGDFDNDEWVVFKENYFPRWKAYIDDKELPILATNQNSVLIRTAKGTMITLKYMVLPIERFFGIISLLSTLVFLIIIIMRLIK